MIKLPPVQQRPLDPHLTDGLQRAVPEHGLLEAPPSVCHGDHEHVVIVVVVIIVVIIIVVVIVVVVLVAYGRDDGYQDLKV